MRSLNSAADSILLMNPESRAADHGVQPGGSGPQGLEKDTGGVILLHKGGRFGSPS